MRSLRWSLLFFIPTIGIIPAVLLKSGTTLTVVSQRTRDRDRERPLSQLRSLIDQSSGKVSEEQLIQLEREQKGTKVEALARFFRAYQRYSNNDFSTSAPLFEEEVIKESGLGDYALFYRAKAYSQIGEYQRAQEAFQQLVDSYQDSLFFDESQVAVGEMLLKQNKPRASIKYLSKLVEEEQSLAILLTAKSYEQVGESDKATLHYKKIYYELPESKESEEAEAKLTQLGFKLPEPDQQLLQKRSNRLFEAGLHGRAVDSYNKLLLLFPETTAKNSYRYGYSLYRINRYNEAIRYLTAVPKENSKNYIDSRYFAAICYKRQKLMPQFVEAALQVLSLNPPAEYGADLLGDLVNYYDKSNESLASRYRIQLTRDYPKSKQADEASYKAAWRVHQTKDYAAGSEALIEHLANFPDTEWRGSVAFWAARDAERAGEYERAIALYEAIPIRYRYGYYGYLAQKRLAEVKRVKRSTQAEKSNTLLKRAVAAIRPAEPLAETVTEKAEPRFVRAASLQTIRLGDLALTELEVARKEAPTSAKINLEIAKIYKFRGENLRAVQALQRAHPDYLSYQGNETSQEVFEIFFPIIEKKTIKEEAKRRGLDPFVVAGLIRQESVFDPRARSRANALGLMQLLPSTGKLVAKKEGAGSIAADQLYNPQLNIRLGVTYLSDMLDKFGRIEYAAAAYNGGPGRVSRWLQTLPDDIEEWVEAIPITETRLYVQGVIRNSAHYRRIYPDLAN
ncbi:MAG: transglycosylase SLT domain-containing protein [Blastocatellia bacterium]|nr:transglycosylase SLT domain-containing protein [Blastocatellia bacterium]